MYSDSLNRQQVGLFLIGRIEIVGPMPAMRMSCLPESQSVIDEAVII